MNVKKFCLILILVGVCFRFYRIDDPWKQHDHYNYGGVRTTMWAECLKSTPLSKTRGVPYGACWRDEGVFYPNHPPTILFAMWGWTSVFGSTEWSYRSFILFFSVLNIGLIFLISREARPGIFPYLAAAMQSCFLGNIYFGTHPDFIGEFTVFFVLLAAWFAIRQRMTAAAIGGLVAGISAWPGYIFFAPLWIYAFMIKKGRKRVFLFGALGGIIAVATMMYLQNTADVMSFLMMKIFDPHYVKPASHVGEFEPLHFLRNFVMSQSRLLSPVLAGVALYQLFIAIGPGYFKRSTFFNLSKFQHAVLLTGGTGFFYALLSHEYFIVHVFLYLLFTPGLALCAARFIERCLDGEFAAPSKKTKWIVCFFVLACAALYPFGIYQSNEILDTFVGAIFVITSLAFIYMFARSRVSTGFVQIIVAATVMGNVLEMINYRNEPAVDYDFCVQMRTEYRATHQPVHTMHERTTTQDMMYCKDIPIIYDNGQQSQ